MDAAPEAMIHPNSIKIKSPGPSITELASSGSCAFAPNIVIEVKRKPQATKANHPVSIGQGFLIPARPKRNGIHTAKANDPSWAASSKAILQFILRVSASLR
ncbi:MAG: hypothetical protein U1F83_10185 [Verrucomicrobiota bacterium]